MEASVNEPDLAVPDHIDVQPPIETDVVIVGAGPVGLFQVFELGLLEIKAHVIDSLPAVGGQCIELYPDKPIYDIPGGAGVHRAGTDRSAAQADRAVPPDVPSRTGSLGRAAARRRPLLRADLARAPSFLCKAVIIAGGVGSFQPRTLKVPGLDTFDNTQVFYRVKDPALFHGKNLVICGGGDSALDWALNFVGKAESVILVHRRDQFRAAPASVAKMHELCEQHEMQLVIGQITGYEEADGRMTEVKVTGDDGVTRRIPLDYLLVFYGL